MSRTGRVASVAKRGLLVLFVLGMGVSIVGAYALRMELKAYGTRVLAGESRWFAAVEPPLRELHHLFDLGVVDADGDGRLDVYTANHNYRQALLLNHGEGEFRDVLSAWGLDQYREFPGWEQSFEPPEISEPGLYIYWLGDTLTLVAHELGTSKPLSGSLSMHSKIGVETNENFEIRREIRSTPESPILESVIHFTVSDRGLLRLTPPSRGVPSYFRIDPGFQTSQIYVGNQRATPATHEFSPYLRDRHGMAWGDFNGDGVLDVFISRGGVGGMLRKLPEAIRSQIRDELLLSGGKPRFEDVTLASGVDKKGCSGRHARWLDFDHDGRMDLFVNCQDRGNVEGLYAKQVYRQEDDGTLSDVANGIDLGLPNREIIDFVWMDLDGDGRVELFTSEDRGFFLYRNQGGVFSEEFLHRTDFVRADVEGLKSEVNNYWRFDGKLTVGDFDSDGDLDIFSASKRGNALLLNEGGSLVHVRPEVYGLPGASLGAQWVDFDNDGRMDLYTVPDGLYRQVATGRFERTGMLVLPDRKYQAAVMHWYDHDNDGSVDLLLALNENPTLWPWWKRPFKTRDDIFLWKLHAYRNTGASNNWLQVELDGPPRNRQGIGARIELHTPEGVQVREMGANEGSYFSQGHYRQYFGLGSHTDGIRVVVHWSDGKTGEVTEVAVNQRLRIGYRDTAGNGIGR